MRLGTWNLLNGMSLDDGRVDASRLRDAAAQLDADVLGLQEVDRGQLRSGGSDIAAEVAAGLGARHWRFAPALVGTPGHRWRAAVDGDDDHGGAAYGVALVSRYPVLSWHRLRLAPARVAVPLPLPAPPTRWRADDAGHRPVGRSLLWLRDEPRVALAGVVDSPIGRLTVVATHLSFVPGWNLLQLRRLRRWLRGFPGPHVVLGDLNMPSWAAGAGSRLTVLARHDTFPASGPRVQLDHVLGSVHLPPVHRSRAQRLAVSDHMALSVDLRL